jgi:hypothetical protein
MDEFVEKLKNSKNALSPCVTHLEQTITVFQGKPEVYNSLDQADYVIVL